VIQSDGADPQVAGGAVHFVPGSSFLLGDQDGGAHIVAGLRGAKVVITLPPKCRKKVGRASGACCPTLRKSSWADGGGRRPRNALAFVGGTAAESPDSSPAVDPLPRDDLAVLLYTSGGTTGVPKGCFLSPQLAATPISSSKARLRPASLNTRMGGGDEWRVAVVAAPVAFLRPHRDETRGTIIRALIAGRPCATGWFIPGRWRRATGDPGVHETGGRLYDVRAVPPLLIYLLNYTRPGRT